MWVIKLCEKVSLYQCISSEHIYLEIIEGRGVPQASLNFQGTTKESTKNLNLNSGKDTHLNLTK